MCLTQYRWTFTILLMITISLLSVILQMKQKLFSSLKQEPAINGIESNQMIANPEKFHLMFLSANEKDLINQQTISIKGISLKSE